MRLASLVFALLFLLPTGAIAFVNIDGLIDELQQGEAGELEQIMEELQTVANPSFPDIARSPYRAAIERLATEEIVQGNPDGTYQPTSPIDRAAFTKIVMNAFRKSEIGGETGCFPDVATEWFAAFVCAAKRLQVIRGYPDGFFRPANLVNSAEAMKIVLEASELEASFPADPTAWYGSYQRYVRDHRLLPTHIWNDPGHSLTREEMAEFISRVLDVLAERR